MCGPTWRVSVPVDRAEVLFYGDGRGVLQVTGGSEKQMRAIGEALRPVASASDESTWLPIA